MIHVRGYKQSEAMILRQKNGIQHWDGTSICKHKNVSYIFSKKGFSKFLAFREKQKHIKTHGIFRTVGIFRTLSRSYEMTVCQNSQLAHIPVSAVKFFSSKNPLEESSYISGNETFLYFSKWSFLALYFSYISGSNFLG